MAEEIDYQTKFTSLKLPGREPYTGAPYPCGCYFCSHECKSTSFGFCSLECSGRTETEVFIISDTLFMIRPLKDRRCRHVHAKCGIPDCKSERKRDFVDAGTREKYMGLGKVPVYPQPFCEEHLPKCRCGFSRFTTAKSGTGAELFNAICAKCLFACPITGCSGSRFLMIAVPKKDKLFGYELSSGCSIHTPAPVEKVMEDELADLMAYFTFIRGNSLYPLISKMKLFSGEKTVDEFQAVCIRSFAACYTDQTLVRKFRDEAAAVATLSMNFDKMFEKVAEMTKEIKTNISQSSGFKKFTTVSVEYKSATTAFPGVFSESVFTISKNDYYQKAQIRTCVKDPQGGMHIICFHESEEQALICHKYLVELVTSGAGTIFNSADFTCSLKAVGPHRQGAAAATG
ncbi:MAG: hypothetical protein Hyperionvirus5_72 [Hyperionvirus sp.]|uniref:Uncharacterized protein n=1 Tax=Hyperionvirus sp. TaxID=2487770 RepID=A0A3G5A7N3_9VIRU|nr:MAG: hypothetical protein Hyperionvirus5_72 [Hyperionvirus sp.]